MGRETKILLALLGLLAGVFLGVVSLKLFVPRPPAGAGPDVHAAVATEPQELVEPPALEPSPPHVPDGYANRASRFSAPVASEHPPRDPFVIPAAYDSGHLADGGTSAQAAALAGEPTAASTTAAWIEDAVEPLPAGRREAAPHPAEITVPPAVPSGIGAGPVPGDGYVTLPGDSWWSLAERAYGDGRLYRALFAWNRGLDPRVSLVPGTRLEIPPAERLGAAWPSLLPAD